MVGNDVSAVGITAFECCAGCAAAGKLWTFWVFGGSGEIGGGRIGSSVAMSCSLVLLRASLVCVCDSGVDFLGDFGTVELSMSSIDESWAGKDS